MPDYKVKNINDADFGDKEISLAETEMPGLMAIRNEYKKNTCLFAVSSTFCFVLFCFS